MKNKDKLHHKKTESGDVMDETIRSGPVISQPNSLVPKMKRLVLKRDCLVLYGFKSGKIRREWVLQDVISVKRHSNNKACFTVTCMERKKNNKIKEKSYSYEVKTERMCTKWINSIQKAVADALVQRIRSATRGRSTTSADEGTPAPVLRRAMSMLIPTKY